MLFIFFSALSGILAGAISIVFRLYELKNSSIYFGKQLLVQIGVFIGLYLLLERFFSFYELQILGLSLSWGFIYFFVNNLVYWCSKIVFEGYSGINLFPSPEEVEKVIERFEDENH